MRRLPPKGSGVRAPLTLKDVALTHLDLTSIPLLAFYALAGFESMTILREKEGRLVTGDLEPMRLLIFDSTSELIEQV
jgi:hypothetical protein